MLSKNIDINYFKKYRDSLGFRNQSKAKEFLGAKDVLPSVNFEYIEDLNTRLSEIINRLDSIVPPDTKQDDITAFNREFIIEAYEIIRDNDILPKLNNQGRRPEGVYFSWMRGYVITNFFTKALSVMFGTNLEDIEIIGDDDLKRVETFKRTPTADLQLILEGVGMIRLEIQSGFQGINDIKQHKVIESKRIFRESDVITLVIHFDLYNGQVGIVRVDNINDDDVNWITRQQMEGQTVFNIDQNYFVWKLMDKCPSPEDIKKIITENE